MYPNATVVVGLAFYEDKDALVEVVDDDDDDIRVLIKGDLSRILLTISKLNIQAIFKVVIDKSKQIYAVSSNLEESASWNSQLTIEWTENATDAIKTRDLLHRISRQFFSKKTISLTFTVCLNLF